MMEVGSIFHKRYKILSVLGRGGMSVVYLAWDQILNCKLAIKEILNTGFGTNDESSRNLFTSEAQLLRQLRHPAIPVVYDVIDEPERICIVMEFIDGSPMDAVLRAHGPQSVEAVVNWARQLAQFLSFIHERNIIYRDMKPANVILSQDNQLKIVDFGIACSTQDNATQIIMGTHGYAPPELYRGQYDQRTDIFSLGMTLHHLLTGIVPDAGNQYLPASHWRLDIPMSLSAIIDRCVQANPDHRYQSCRELLSALDHLPVNTATKNGYPDSFNSFEENHIFNTAPHADISVPTDPVISAQDDSVFSLPFSVVLLNPENQVAAPIANAN